MPEAKGVYGILAAQYEETFGEDPASPDMTLIPFESESLKSSQNQIKSKVMTGTRFETRPGMGNIDASGGISTELGAYPGMLFAAAAGSVKTEANSGAGEALGAALTTPTATIDRFAGTITISAAAHGVAVGNAVKIEGITAPTALNDTYLRCMRVVDTGNFVCRVPLGVSGTFTLGAGTIKPVTTPATTYLHTFKFGGALPSLVIEKGFQDIGAYMKYNGMRCSKMSLSTPAEGFQPISFDFVGKKETPGTSAFDTAATDLGKTSFDGFEGALEEGGSSIAIVNSLKFDIDNTLDTGKYLFGGGGQRSRIPYGKVKVSGSIEALFEDLTLYNKAVNGAESSLKAAYTKGTGAGTAGNEYFEIFVPELRFGREAPVISGEDGIMVTLPFEAYFYDSAQGTTCQITLKNTQLAP